MKKDLTKYTKEELYNQIFLNYEDQVRILKDIIEGRDKFIAMLEKQLVESDKHIERLYDEIGSASNEQKGVLGDGKEMQTRKYNTINSNSNNTFSINLFNSKMKVIYMESTLALIAGINPNFVDELSKIGELKTTETMRYLLIQEIDGENR